MAFYVADSPPELVDLRCPSELPGRDGQCHPGKLLARILGMGGRPSWVQPDNLIELECPDCKARMRRLGRRVARVLHRFDFAGEPAGTLVVEEDQRGLAGPARGITSHGDARDIHVRRRGVRGAGRGGRAALGIVL